MPRVGDLDTVTWFFFHGSLDEDLAVSLELRRKPDGFIPDHFFGFQKHSLLGHNHTIYTVARVSADSQFNGAWEIRFMPSFLERDGKG